MKLLNNDISAMCPTFSRLLQSGSRFRRNVTTFWLAFCCVLTVFFSMALLSDVARALYWHLWKTFEYGTAAEMMVLPFCLLVSSFIGCNLGRKLGFSRSASIIVTILGLAAFYYVSIADWLSWFLPYPIIDLFDGWFAYSFALEYANSIFSGGKWSDSHVAQWILIGLWTSAGCLLGSKMQIPSRFCLAKAIGGVVCTLILSSLLLGSIFYPIAYAEKDREGFIANRIHELGSYGANLRKENESLKAKLSISSTNRDIRKGKPQR